MSAPDPSPPPFRSIARRQAVLTAGAAFLASMLVEATVLNVASRDVETRIEGRFVDLANERGKQIESVVAGQYALVGQIAANPRLREIVAPLVAGDGAEVVREAEAALRDAAVVAPQVRRIDVVTPAGVVLASTDSTRVGGPPRPYLVPPGSLRRPIVTPPAVVDGQVAVRVVAPVRPPGDGPAAAQAVVAVLADASAMMTVLTDTRPLGQGGSMAILEDTSPILRGIAGSEQPAESGLRQVDAVLGPTLFYWQPVTFNPGETDRWRFLASLPVAEAYAPLRRLRWLLAGLGGLVAVLATIASYLVARRLGRRLSDLTRVAERAAAGELTDLEIPVTDMADEVGVLAGAFNAMGQRVGTDLRQARSEAEAERAERARLVAELELAREVQSRLYPAEPLRTPGVEVAGRSVPAEHLCGDYFDYFESPDGLVFAVGDVSGHGVGPSLLMVEVRSVLRSLRRRPEPLLERVNFLNDRLAEESPAGRFVSLLAGRLDPTSGELEYVGAGHRGLIVREGGVVEPLRSTGLLLGLFPGAEMETGRVTLHRGDVLCVASDGIEETADAAGRQFGWKRVADAASAAADRPVEEIMDAILDRSLAHGGGRPPADDRTVLVLRRT